MYHVGRLESTAFISQSGQTVTKKKREKFFVSFLLVILFFSCEACSLKQVLESITHDRN